MQLVGARRRLLWVVLRSRMIRQAEFIGLSMLSKLRLERGTIKATVLIETLSAAFEMEEILYALRENIVGLNCGRSADLLTPTAAR